MTRVDFYQLSETRHKADLVVCQLCHKAYENNQRTLLLTQNEQQTAQLDRLLWTFNDDSFLPHDDDDCALFAAPILIHDKPETPGERDLLINLSSAIPQYFARFERIIELVTEDNKTLARQHYSFYKERGYPLKHVTL